jgi:hypothetical protein
LASSSVPEEAREKAGEKTEACEEITNLRRGQGDRGPGEEEEAAQETESYACRQLAGRLVMVLERYRYRWAPSELAELACHLREFADSLDSQEGAKKTKKE